MTEEINWDDPNLDLDSVLGVGLEDIDKIEGFNTFDTINKTIKSDLDINDIFSQIDVNLDLENGLYEIFLGEDLIGQWNFIISDSIIHIKYVEKFINKKGFGTLMFIDFFALLKSKGIVGISSEIDSSEVQAIYSKLIERGIISNTSDGYVIN